MQITDSSPASTDWLVVEVCDTGCGMDDATRAHTFEPFFTTKPLGRGTGLGLSTVYGIVHQFGGHIRVQSRPAVGTTFQLFFPAIMARSEVQPAVVRELDRAPETGKFTILLADNETAIRQAIAEYLRSAGQRRGDGGVART